MVVCREGRLAFEGWDTRMAGEEHPACIRPLTSCLPGRQSRFSLPHLPLPCCRSVFYLPKPRALNYLVTQLFGGPTLVLQASAERRQLQALWWCQRGPLLEWQGVLVGRATGAGRLGFCLLAASGCLPAGQCRQVLVSDADCSASALCALPHLLCRG